MLKFQKGGGKDRQIRIFWIGVDRPNRIFWILSKFKNKKPLFRGLDFLVKDELVRSGDGDGRRRYSDVNMKVHQISPELEHLLLVPFRARCLPIFRIIHCMQHRCCINMTKNEQIFEHRLWTNKGNTYKDEYYEDPDNDVDIYDTIISDTESDSEFSTANDAKGDNGMSNFIVPGDSNNYVSHSILQTLLDNKDMINEYETNTMLHRIKTTLTNSNESLESPAGKFYTSAYGSCPIYKVDDGTRLIAIPYMYLYQYRGEKLKDLCWVEYFSIIQIHKDWPDDNDSEQPHLQYKRGWKKSKQLRFGDRIDISTNHNQVVHSKLCTPKFFKNTPSHPGQKPKESNSTSDALRQ